MEDLVMIRDGKIIVTSKMVADKFEKVHNHVMRDIRKLVKDDELFGASNFGLSSYISLQNKELPCFEMTRDGFTLLAMGFTGKEATKWKIKYINAFTQMEKALTDQKGLMGKINDAVAVLERDSAIASEMGKGLSSWKKIKKAHESEVNRLVAESQILLNLK